MITWQATEMSQTASGGTGMPNRERVSMSQSCAGVFVPQPPQPLSADNILQFPQMAEELPVLPFTNLPSSNFAAASSGFLSFLNQEHFAFPTAKTTSFK
ncbi:hypothetical protein JCGZ_09317 [Jatropha curcas]|uniref:Uncharacterized protein n=1 Tax=Jatropha curcas TaxID=180498 RepID=A0A067KT58_JATCU|nr:hypothetical protein JCGZ_09317 [Jatropha curcas]